MITSNKENLFQPNSIRAYSGIYVDGINPTPEMFTIEDIAVALSRQPRWMGHARINYSVAMHSMCCCMMAPEEYKLEALMHDASEAYIADIPRPFKKLIAGYYEIEEKFMKAISEKFGFTYPISDVVKEIDNKMLHFEWDVLVLMEDKNKVVFDVNYLTEEQQVARFLELYNQYKVV